MDQAILASLQGNTDPNLKKQTLLYLSLQLSKQLKQVLKKVDVVVWPGTNLADGRTIFVCVYKGTIEEGPKSFYDIEIFYSDCEKPRRNPMFSCKDLLSDDLRLTYEDAVFVERAIKEHGDSLFDKHSNLEAISGSAFVLSMSEDLIRRKCVVLYCQMKGIAPYGEDRFPTSLQVGDKSLRVDVREGYFRQGMFQQNSIVGRTEWHDQLRMGISIGVKNEDLAGTLGPFVKLGKARFGFLTCAHVVNCREKVKVLQPADGESNQDKPESERYCGKVLKVAFTSKLQTNGLTENIDVGVDAALVQIEGKRTIDPRNFPNIPKTDLLKAGFDAKKPPSLGHGPAMCAFSFEDIQGKRVIKCGRTTGFTKGSLELHGAQIKRRDATMLLPNSASSVTMKGQYIVERHGDTPFFDLGDSGAAVFVASKENELTCIGLAIGKLNDFQCVVTPIGYVLNALGLRPTDLAFKDNSDTADLNNEEEMETS